MLRVRDIAKRLALSESKVYQLIRSGELPHYKLGGALRVSEEQLMDYLVASQKGRVEAPEVPPPAPTTRPKLRHIKLS